MKGVKKILLIILLPLGFRGFSQDEFARAERLFFADRVEEALPVLESLAAAGNSRAAFYLGVALQKTGDLDRAIAVFTQILPDAGGDKALVAFNLANLYFAKDENVFAEAYYSQTIEADRNYAPAYLNRANVRVRTGALEKALEDYAAYLRLVPDSPQRAAIDALVAMVKADLAAEAAERAAAEKAAREEAEARRRVLEQVFSSIAFP